MMRFLRSLFRFLHKRTYLRVDEYKSRHRVTEIRDGGLSRHWRESGNR